MVRKSLDYQGLARKDKTVNEDGYIGWVDTQNWGEPHEMPMGPTINIEELKRRRFNVIDRAVEKARKEMDEQITNEKPPEK